MERNPLTVVGNILDSIIQMAEGNPGAATVLGSIMKTQGDLGYMTILHLDDMNIRGSQIWNGYKVHCGQDIQKFIGLVEKKDQGLVDFLNGSVTHGGHWKAVTSGASYMPSRPTLK